MTTIQSASASWLETVRQSRSKNTHDTYAGAWRFLSRTLQNNKVDPSQTEISEISEKVFIWLSDDLKQLSPYTESLYYTAIKQFFFYLMSEDLATFNMMKVQAIIKQRGRIPGKRFPQFHSDEIELFIDRTDTMPIAPDIPDRLIDLRDRALILLLPASGLRISEACSLLRGEVDWVKHHAVIVGKGDKQAVVRLGEKSVKAMSLYLKARAHLDGDTGKPLAMLPVFARHDRGAGSKIKPITTATGRKIVARRLSQLLTEEERKRITPHSFRHYFVSAVYDQSRDLVLAQEMARHDSVETTKRYTHLNNEKLDQAHYEIFDKKK